jgi:UDP-GlcNAc:undecaprenyl-phosphate/decaprenyl-phosphate GlcNAc-1-phosphate transferase
MPNQDWSPLLAAALAAAVCAAVLRLILGTRIASFALDRPNDRSMHSRPTPRIGGIGILAGIAVGIVAAAVMTGDRGVPVAIWAGLGVLVVVSVIDDLRSLRASVRLPLHLLASGVAVWALVPQAGWPAVVVLTLLIGWMLNLYNFMDGSDGLAGGQALIGFGAYLVAALLGGDLPIAIASAAIAGGCAGFLLFNFPPARIFMGDAGSTSLGFLAGTLGLLGAVRGQWSPLFPLLAFLPFVFDASATLALRLLRGSRVWEAHREHAYQRLNMAGFGHRRTALVYWALMAVCAAVAIATRGEAAAAAAVLLAAHACLYYGVQRHWSRRQSSPKPS